MYFDFSDEQESLRDMVRKFMSNEAPISYVRDMYDDPRGTTPEVWNGLAGLGLTGILVPEELGGMGLGLVDMGVVLEELGRAVHPGPFFSSAVAAVSAILAVGEKADHADLLPSIASGEVVATLGLLEAGQRYQWKTPATQATQVGDGWQVSGTKTHVPDAFAADLLLVTAATSEGLGLFAVQRADATVTADDVLDGTRKQATVELTDAPARRVGTADATVALGTAIDRILIGTVVDAVGAGQAALDLAVDYAKNRTQFGSPIGAYQHVQRLLVDTFESVEMSRTAGYYGLWACDDGDPAEGHRAASMAKAFASDALPAACADALQSHGGMGVTWEYDSHLFYKRCLSMQHSLGGAAEHQEEVAAIIAAG